MGKPTGRRRWYVLPVKPTPQNDELYFQHTGEPDSYAGMEIDVKSETCFKAAPTLSQMVYTGSLSDMLLIYSQGDVDVAKFAQEIKRNGPQVRGYVSRASEAHRTPGTTDC